MKIGNIMFTNRNVEKIISGLKDQTRRVIEPQPNEYGWVSVKGSHYNLEVSKGIDGFITHCPKGKPGDRLWVKEPCWMDRYKGKPRRAFFPGRDIRYEEGRITKQGKLETIDSLSGRMSLKGPVMMLMPRWASRLTVEITEVRVQRLDAISPEDCVREGAKDKDAYVKTWNFLNEKRGFGWDKNPWVWAITLKVVS